MELANPCELRVTSVPRCSGSNAKTLGLKYLQLPDMGASDGPADGARVVHHWTVELLIQQYSVSDGQATRPVKKRTQHSQSLGLFTSDLNDMRRPDQPCIKGHPQITGGVDPMDWLPEQLSGRDLEQRGALRDIE
jgi:hypothetical protein